MDSRHTDYFENLAIKNFKVNCYYKFLLIIFFNYTSVQHLLIGEYFYAIFYIFLMKEPDIKVFKKEL